METLNKLYNETDLVYFGMACTYLLQIGFDKARKITDMSLEKTLEDLKKKDEECGGMSIISPELNIWIMKTAREIANSVSEVQFMQWIIVNKIYDTKGIKKA